MTDHSRRIDAALTVGDIAGAAAIAMAALAAGAREPRLLNLAAWQREQIGDLEGASEFLQEALALDPGDPLILTSIGRTLRLQGQLSEAVATLDKAIAAGPGNAVAWLERGYVFEAGTSLHRAGESYLRAAQLDPALAPAWAGAAAMAGRIGQIDAARDFARNALAAEPGNAKALCALARAEIEQGQAEQAAAGLRRIPEDAPTEDRIVGSSLLGDALDRAGQPLEAFSAYVESNAMFAGLHGARRTGASYREWVDSILSALDGLDPASWTRLPVTSTPEEPRVHAFLLGFPRSGTTLVENILASMDEVVATEELLTLAEPARAFLRQPDGLAQLAALEDEAASEWRQTYWTRIASYRVALAGKTYIDMDPLKGPMLPLIGRLFPDARVIVMRRDPRDVVWSCFRTAFAPTAASLEFTDIERTARLYDAVMRLTERCLATMQNPALDLRYDRLVSDFDRTTAELCGFLDLPWSPALRTFDKTARRRGVTTASSGQVVKGLYDGGNQWRRYEAQLAPALPILKPWIEKLEFQP